MATNPFFDHVNSPFRHLPLTLVRAAALNARLDEVTAGFDGVKTQLDLKAPLASPTFSGTVTFNTTALSITGGTVTMTAASTVTIPSPGAVSENSSRAATTAWVQSLVGSLSVGLPPQATHSGKYLRTDGTSASWQFAPARQIQIFTSSGTFTPPAGVEWFHVILIGGGGGGNGSPNLGCGGAGGAVWGLMQITAPVTVTIGAGGPSSLSGPAGPGGASSIGSIATAGGGGAAFASGVGGNGGSASTTAPGCIAVPGENGFTAFNMGHSGGTSASLFGSRGPGGAGNFMGAAGNPGIAIFMW